MEKQSKKRGVLVAGIALVLVLAGGAVAYALLAPRQSSSTSTSAQTTSSSSTPNASSSASQEAPQLADFDATVYTIGGEPVELSQIANGKPLVINFWATWCPYCVKEFPDYQTILSEYGDRVSFAFVDVPGSKGETPEKALEWLQQNGYEDFPAYFDNDWEASGVFGARSLPTTAVVSAEGEIQGISAGMIDPQRLGDALHDLTQ